MTTNIQLSKAQTEILSAACKRPDGAVFPTTGTLKGGALRKVCQSLLKRELVEESAATDENAIWRHDNECGPLNLRATPLAYSTLGIKQDIATSNVSTPAKHREGTKQAMLIEMLRAENGVTIAEISKTTGWRSHTIRGAISGALKKKLGLDVTSEKIDGRGRVYRLALA